jgi:NAD(P)-dependent dehydrogenase (short-subunit alcohol dehydrogenase family)
MSNELAGKVAIVTGGGSGIGKAISKSFVKAGAMVAVVDRDLNSANDVAAALTNEGGRATGIEFDVTAVERIDAMLDQVVTEFDRIDVLVNNAGVGFHVPFREVTPDIWDRIHSVNARGAFFVMQCVAERMVAQGDGGSIINVTSVVADRPWLNNAAYGPSKAALRIATGYAANELGQFGIRVNNLCPGPTDTPLTAAEYHDPEFRPRLLADIPLGRIGQPEDLAKAAVFLAGAQSSFTTGSTLYVDGGRLAR